MKLKEFLDNPAGKGDSSLNRAVLKETLDAKYNRLIREKEDKIKVTVYRVLMSNNYYIHLVIPTETKRDNTYDVVLFFEQEEKTALTTSLLSTHNVKFFANSPSFAYTFGKVYYDEGLLIDSLKHKFPDEILNQAPEVRNRYGIVNYDKYIYFGCKYIYESKMLNTATMGLRSTVYNPKTLDIKVRSLDKILIEYRKAENKLKKNEKETVSDTVKSALTGNRKPDSPSINRIKPKNKNSHVKSKKKGRR